MGVHACGGRRGGVGLRPFLPIRRTNPQIRDAALTAYPAEQEVTCRRLLSLEKVRLRFHCGTSQEIAERLRGARANHLLCDRRIGERIGGRAIEAAHAGGTGFSLWCGGAPQFPIVPRQSQRRSPVFPVRCPEVVPRPQHARVMVDVRPRLKAYPGQHIAGVGRPADIDHGAGQALNVAVEHDPGARHGFAGRPIDDVTTGDGSRSGQEAARNQAAESRDFAFVAQRVAAAAIPKWMRCEALPAQYIRLEHAVILVHVENGPQEARYFAQLGLGYRRDQRATPFKANTDLSLPTLVLSTVSSIVNLTPNSSSQPIMSFTCARLSHCGMLSGESASVRVSLSLSKASRKICCRRRSIRVTAYSTLNRNRERTKTLDLATHLVEGRRSPGGIEIELARQRRLVDGRRVCFARKHVSVQPLFRTSDRLWIRWGGQVWPQASIARNRFGRSYEPVLELSLCENHSDWPPVAGSASGPIQEHRRQLFRTIVVAVDDDQHYAR